MAKSKVQRAEEYLGTLPDLAKQAGKNRNYPQCWLRLTPLQRAFCTAFTDPQCKKGYNRPTGAARIAGASAPRQQGSNWMMKADIHTAITWLQTLRERSATCGRSQIDAMLVRALNISSEVLGRHYDEHGSIHKEAHAALRQTAAEIAKLRGYYTDQAVNEAPISLNFNVSLPVAEKASAAAGQPVITIDAEPEPSTTSLKPSD